MTIKSEKAEKTVLQKIVKVKEPKATKAPKVLEMPAAPKIGKLTAENKKHLAEIREFFNETGIEFKEVNGYFEVNNGANTGVIQIRYVDSASHKTDYSKRFGIVGIQKGYFSNTSKVNRENGIRTIWIKDWEYRDERKRNVLQSYIRTATGKIGNRVYARDTEVRVLETKDLKPFLIANCFYGFRASSLALGLYAKKTKGDIQAGTLLMAYTFGHPFFGSKLYDVEVIRVGTLLNTQVIGGASKLLKHFTDNYPVLKIGPREVPTNKLVFYVDADHNDGRSLESIGFKYVGWTNAGFMNVEASTGKVSHRSPMEHKRIMERMAAGEMYSVENAGTIVYMLERENLSDESEE